MTIEIVTGDTGFCQPLNTTIGFLDSPYNAPFTALFIIDLAANRALAVGDLIEIDLEFEATNPNDPRPNSEYTKVCSLCSGILLTDTPSLDINTSLPHRIAGNNGENAPFLTHHKRVQQHGRVVVSDTSLRYAIGFAYAETGQSSMSALNVESTAGESRMCYKITRGATDDGRSGNGSDLISSPVTITYQGSTSNTADQSSYTFTSQPFGTASADRKIIVVTAGPGSNTVSSMTIGGVTATHVVGAIGAFNSDVADIWIADVPTGTTGTVVVNFGATMARATIGVYSMTGASSSTPYDTSSVTQTTTNPVSGDTDIPVNGAAVAITRTVGSSGFSVAWSGLTENFDLNVESGSSSVSGACVNLPAGASPRTITLSIAGSGLASTALAVASWGP